MTASRLLLMMFAFLASLALCELAVRLFGCSHFLGEQYQNEPFLAANGYWGIWHFANEVVEHQSSCFDAHYRTNDLGMKSTSIRAEAPKIALLGDSFVEGFGNGNESSLDQAMQRLLGGRYDVLNFGISGGFATVDELVLYDDLVRFLHPELCVLFFVNYNDVEENADRSKERFIDRDLKFVYPRAGSLKEVASHIRDQKITQARKRADRGLCLGRIYRVAEKVIRLRMQMILNLRWDFRDELARPYLDEEDADLRRGWSVAEVSLARLRELTRQEGTTLVVVDIADPYQLDDNWLRISSLRIGKQLDPTRPNRRLAEICRKLGIRYYDMYPDAKHYVETHHLRFPYLSFDCDRHYNAEGQELMARLVVRHLQAEGVVDRGEALAPRASLATVTTDR